jgi:pyroglutamyl-peptidase
MMLAADRQDNEAPREPLDRAVDNPRMPILVTGFEPFGGHADNPSMRVALALDGEVIDRQQVAGRVLPCAFDAALAELHAQLDTLQPSLVLALGLAAGRTELSFERVAVNLIDARIVDNCGAQPVDCAVVDGAPAAHFTALPVKRMVAAVRALGIPAGLSMSAGIFVCNAVFYALRQHGLRGGFAHLPLLPEQGAPSLPLPAMVDGVRAALAVAAEHRDDVATPAGTLA